MEESLVGKALRIAAQAHRGQIYKPDRPYIEHVQEVVALLELWGENETTCAAGALHDVVEDTSIDLQGLRLRGIPENVLRIVGLLTHSRHMPYEDYIRDLMTHPHARRVKQADMTCNLRNTQRLPEPMRSRLRDKYMSAYQILTGEQWEG